jgi:hypothetical protein
MAEPGDGGTENALDEVERVSPMTSGERFLFWCMPSSLALCGASLLAVGAFVWVRISIALLVSFQKYLNHPERLKALAQDLMAAAIMEAFAVALAAIFLFYPALVLRKMLRRKRETGSVLPQGEELAARRRKWKNPSWWTKTWVPGFFALIASGWTYKCITAPHRLPLAVWSFPALAWVIVVMVAIDCFFPRPDRIWTGICDSVAFGALAAVYLIGAPHAMMRKTTFWIFPFLTGGIAIVLAFWVIRDWSRRRGRAPAASTLP